MGTDAMRDSWRALTATVEPRRRTRSSRKPDRQPAPWTEVAGILAAGNLATGLSWLARYPINSGPFAVTLAAGLGGYVWLRRSQDQRRELLCAAWPLRQGSVFLAVAGGLALAVPSLLGLWVAATRGQMPTSDIQQLSGSGLAVRLMVEIPLLTALPEELTFREHLYPRLLAASPARTALRNAAIFTLWHPVVAWRTVLQSGYPRRPLVLAGAYLGALAGIFAGGLVFAVVRMKTGSFVYSALAHWLAVVLITLGTWRLGRRQG